MAPGARCKGWRKGRCRCLESGRGRPAMLAPMRIRRSDARTLWPILPGPVDCSSLAARDQGDCMVEDPSGRRAVGALGRRSLLRGLAGAAALAPLSGCSGEPESVDLAGAPRAPGTIVSVRQRGWWPAAASRVVLDLAKVAPAVPIAHDFTPYRLTYWSTTNGAPVLVSALVTIPNARPPRGLVLWMHGTNPDRAKSVSGPSLQEGVAVSAAFAGGGYAVLAPDLVGLGVSRGPQAYLYNPSTVPVTLDLLRIAARGMGGLLPAPPRNVFVTGFSQGGHDAAVIHRALEADPQSPMQVRATAAIAGAYDLAGVSIPFALQGRSSGDSLYLGLLALSWSTYHGRPLESVLTASAARRVRQTLDGAHAADLDKALPRNPRDLFRPDFLQAADTGGPHWFLDAARQNEAHDWTPKAPYRAYFGDNDVDVTPQDSIRFIQAVNSRGAKAEAVALGPYTHGESALHAVPRIRGWFDELTSAA